VTGRTLYVPATSLDEARTIANGVAAGRIGHLDHYLDQAAAERVRDHFNRLSPASRREVFRIEVRVVDDGTIANVWPVDQVGDAMAALIIFALIPLVGFASLWERAI
jgi:hypothetical protein